jgi:hypothetical protein
MVRTWISTIGVLLFIVMVPAASLAREEPQAANELPARTRTFKQKYPAASAPAVAAGENAVREALDGLDKYLPANDANSSAWKQYLEWETLQEELTKGTEADLDVLRGVYAKFTSNEPGLERPVLSRVADALHHYIDVLTFATMPDVKERHEEQMELLAASLEGYAEDPTEQRALAIGQGLEWLEASGQAADLVRAIRAHYSHPNLLVDASRRLVASGLAEPIEYTETLNDNILGVSISGMGHTTAAVDLQLVPDARRANARMVVQGKTDVDTVGRNGPVTITGDGVTTFVAHKTLQIDEDGFSGQPAGCQARSCNRAKCVSGGPFMRRLAWIRIRRQQAEGNQIAARHAEVQISRRIDQEGSENIREANDAYLARFRNPLLRQRQFPARLKFSTTSDSMHVVGLQANRSQLGSPRQPPETLSAHDLVARLHESVFNNLSAGLLADRILTDEDLSANFPEFLQPFVERLRPTEDEQPWSIAFASDRPISVRFVEGGFNVTIRGQRWTSGKRKFKAMNVSAAYRIESGSDGIELLREGELEIVPPGFVSGKGRLNFSQIALRRVLARKFNRLFEPTIGVEEMELPGPWKRAGKLRGTQMDSNSGWLRIGWMLTAPEEVTRKVENLTH